MGQPFKDWPRTSEMRQKKSKTKLEIGCLTFSRDAKNKLRKHNEHTLKSDMIRTVCSMGKKTVAHRKLGGGGGESYIQTFTVVVGTNTEN